MRKPPVCHRTSTNRVLPYNRDDGHGRDRVVHCSVSRPSLPTPSSHTKEATMAQLFGLAVASIRPMLAGIVAGQGGTSSDPRIADLAAAGKLRVGIGLGTPALALKNASTGETKGPALELARALAAGMGLPLETVEYPRPGAVLDGARSNAWDVAFLVMDASRGTDADFAPPYMQSDFTYLVPPGSPLQSAEQVDRPGMRIAVPRGDASDLALTRIAKHAELVRADSLAGAVDLLRTGEAHARAAPRPVLLSEAAGYAGSRVLDDGFAVISYAALVPKGHAERLAYVAEFMDGAKATGLVQRTIDTAGLRGVRVAIAAT